MTAVGVSALTKRFASTTALDDVSFSVAEGEFLSIVGPTNAGKSTLLKTIAGLYRPDRGRIMLGREDITDRRPDERMVSLLFQNIALFPSMTGFENIAFPLRRAGLAQAEVDRIVHSTAELLKISHVLDRLPKTFSGGEQQRTAIGRSIVRPGKLLLLDEPLTNLDARMRISLRIEFKKLHRERRQTIIYVTHDQVEAMSLSDRVAVLHQGRFQQIGSPDDIYHRPANRFVAEFIGSPPMNILVGDLMETGSALRLVDGGADIALPRDYPLQMDPNHRPRRIAVGIRPENVKVAPVASAETPTAARVRWVEHLGSKLVLSIRVGHSDLKAVVAADHPVRAEGTAWIGLRPRSEHFLDPDTGVFFGARNAVA